MRNWLKHIVAGLFIAFYFTINGQENCISSSVRTGCTPFLAQIDYCGPLKEDGTAFPTLYTYGDGTQTTSDTHLYTQDGLFSISQKIAIQAGKPTIDSVFKDFFRVVSTPDFTYSISKCKDKAIRIEIDSNSYDFYEISNNITSEKDTIFNFGSIELSFSAFSNTEVTLEIIGKYSNADCKQIKSTTIDFIDQILPTSISQVSEFQKISIDLDYTPDIENTLSLIKNNAVISSITEVNKNEISLDNSIDYDKILLSSEDACGNSDTALFLDKFTSQTTFESNKNTIGHTSPSFIPSSFIYYNRTSQEILTSNIDENIQCGIKDCYSIRSNENNNNYTFLRESNGNCDISFSLTKPIIELLSFDNSAQTKSILSIQTNSDIKLATINGNNFTPSANQTIEFDYSEECQNVSITNSCDQTSSIKNVCPLILKNENYDLLWNGDNTDLHTLFWISIKGDTNLLGINQLRTYTLNSKNLPAQEFCIFVQNDSTNSKSNTICFKDIPFFFIPDLVYKSKNILSITTRYIKTYTLALHDSNGNLVSRSNESAPLDIKNINSGTYFYFFDGISENNSSLKTSGSILIKD